MTSYSKLSQHAPSLLAMRRTAVQIAHLQENGPVGRGSGPRKSLRSRNVRARLVRDQLEQLVRRYKSGTPTTQLMVEFKLNKTAVLALLHGACVEMRRQPLTGNQIESAMRLYESGLTVATTARQFGLATESVRRALVEAGASMRAPGSRTNSRRFADCCGPEHSR